jgi:gliding motility-associated-like protein
MGVQLKTILVFSLFLLNRLLCFAQNPVSGVFTGCGSDLLHHGNAGMVSGQAAWDSLAYIHFAAASHHQSNSTFAVAHIPVVVHIIHNNGAENISDAQVQAAISNINAKFQSGNGYQIQFCLAQQDPQGLATTGITRNVSTFTNETMEIDDITLKNINRWPPTCYLNIWVVHEIMSVSMGSGVIGYAFFPSAAGSNIDGVVIEAGFFGNNAQDDAVGAHEIGHYLGLYHTFQNGCANNDCLADGDQVCDTPPDQTTFASCSPPSNSCSTDADDPSANNPFSTDVPDLGEDYMDYSNFSCYNQFTPGQYSRMQYFLTTARASLLNCPSCNSPCPAPITATITSPPSGTTITTGTTLNFTGTAVNSGNLQWYLIPSSILSTGTSLSYTFSTAGTYWIKFTALTGNPTNCLSGIDSVQIIVSEPVVTSCNGSLDFQDASPAADLPLNNQYYSGTNGGYTWECWFKLDQLPPGTLARPLISAMDEVTFEDMYLGFGWDGGWGDAPVSQLVWKVDGPSSATPTDINCTYAPPGGFVTGTWYHAAGVADYTTQTKKLFLNGVPVSTEQLTYTPNSRAITAELSFAYNWLPPYTTAPRPLHGKMDEVRIWTVAKTDAEILANYNTCMTGSESNLFLYYRCNQSAGSSIVDATANSMDGTFVQSPGWSSENAPLTGTSCVIACIEICGNGIDDNSDGQIDEGCSCPTISAGNDTTTCSGGSVQLNASPGFTTYSWAPATGLDDPTIANPTATPASTTDYTVTATTPGPNFVVNPDFSAGNFGFTSGQTYSSVYTPCNYNVASGYFIYTTPDFTDHTPTLDNMSMSIDGCTSGPTVLWEETIPSLQTGTNYTFSFWASRADQVQPTFEIHFIGNVTGDVLLATIPGIPYAGVWTWDQYGVPSWNSGLNTSVTLRVVNLQTNGYGNDFGLDDFSFGKLCTATDTVTVTVVTNPAAPLDLGPDIQMCTSATHTFDAGSGHLSYHWNDGDPDQTYTAYGPGTYWVTVTDSCGGTQTDTVHITQVPAPTLTLPNDTAFCIGSNVLLSYTSSGTFSNLLWSPASGLSCIHCSNPVATPTGTITYYLVASTSDGCTGMDSIRITVGTSAPTAISFSIPCDSNGTIILGAVSGGIPPYQYNFNSLGFSGTTTYTGLSTGNYPLSIKDYAGCIYDTTLHVIGDLTPPGAVSYLATNNQCGPNGTLTIHSVTGGIPPYLFNFNNLGFGPDTLFSGLSANTYTLSVKDSAGCLLDVPIVIAVDYLAPASVDLHTTFFTCDSGGTVSILNISGGSAPYLFSVNNSSYSGNSYYTELAAGLYSLSVKDSNNCALDTSFAIYEFFDYEAIYIPNCFTPNHDVFNDTWSVKGSCIESIDCRIYNRWGEEIAHLMDISDSWDGTYKKQPVQNGVYMYVLDIRYHSQNTERRSGAINVLR